MEPHPGNTKFIKHVIVNARLATLGAEPADRAMIRLGSRNGSKQAHSHSAILPIVGRPASIDFSLLPSFAAGKQHPSRYSLRLAVWSREEKEIKVNWLQGKLLICLYTTYGRAYIRIGDCFRGRVIQAKACLWKPLSGSGGNENERGFRRGIWFENEAHKWRSSHFSLEFEAHVCTYVGTVELQISALYNPRILIFLFALARIVAEPTEDSIFTTTHISREGGREVETEGKKKVYLLFYLPEQMLPQVSVSVSQITELFDV